MDHIDQDVQCGHDDGVIKGLEGPKEQKDEGVQLILELLLNRDRAQSSLLVLVSNKYKALLFERFAETLKAKVCQDTSANLLCLLLGDLLVCLNPLHLDSMTLLHQFCGASFREQVIDLGSIVSHRFLVVDFGLHRHCDSFLNNGVQEDKKLISIQCLIFEELAANSIQHFFALLDPYEGGICFEYLDNRCQ